MLQNLKRAQFIMSTKNTAYAKFSAPDKPCFGLVRNCVLIFFSYIRLQKIRVASFGILIFLAKYSGLKYEKSAI